MIRNLIAKIPLWGWVGIGIAILLMVNSASSYFYQRSLFNFALDNLRKDKTAIVEDLNENLKVRNQTIADLKKQVKEVQKQERVAQAESERLRRLDLEKDAQILAFKKEREAIIVSGDPDRLVDELHKMGYLSGRVVRNR